MDKITLITTLKDSELRDASSLYYFENITIPLINKNFNTKDILEWIIICPTEDLIKIKDLTFKYKNIHFNIVDENVYVQLGSVDGYTKQMLLKLLVSNQIKTDYYLILDYDCLCMRPTSFNSLIQNKKCPITFVSNTHFYQDWWHENSAIIVDNNIKSDLKMEFTPQIFITSVVQDLIKYIVDKYESDFVNSLIKAKNIFLTENKHVQNHIDALYDNVTHETAGERIHLLLSVHHSFTEYGLYWNWIMKNDLINNYDIHRKIYKHFYTGPKWVLFLESAIPQQTVDQLEYDLRMTHCLFEDYPFLVLQSTAGYKVNDLIKILNKYNLL